MCFFGAHSPYEVRTIVYVITLRAAQGSTETASEWVETASDSRQDVETSSSGSKLTQYQTYTPYN